MSHIASAYAKALSVCPNGEKINRTEKLILLILADYHNTQRGVAWPSVPRLAAEAIMDERLARKTLGALETKGVLERVRPDDQGRGQLTQYRFCEIDGNDPEKEGENVPLILKKGYKIDQEGGYKGVQNRSRNKEELEPIELNTPSLRSEVADEDEGPQPQKRKKNKGQQDPRLLPFKAQFYKFWIKYNPNIPVPWGKSDWSQLYRFLADNPELKEDHWRQILYNRARSEAVVKTQPLYQWAKQSMKYAAGPLDRFGLLLNSTQAHEDSRPRNFNEADEAIARSRAKKDPSRK